MPTFKYFARDSAGKASSGSIQAADESELRRILRMNDLYLVNHRGGGSGAAATSKETLASQSSSLPPQPGFFDAKPKMQDMVIATRQLASTTRAGLPLLQALDIVGSQSEKPVLRRAFQDIMSVVREGQYLSAGLKRHPKLFNQLVVSLVEAGEIAGTLEETLEVAAEQLDREDDLRRRVKAATMYPKLVILACIGTITVMLLVVVPVFADVYKSLHAKLPMATELLITTSDFVLHKWYIGAALIAAGTFAFKKYRDTTGGSRRLDYMSIRIPVLGPVLLKIAIARFVQTLAGAMKGGVPVLSSLAISANTAGNAAIREAVLTAAQNVRDGAAIAPELERTGQFPLMVTRMVAAGEATGNIDAMLEEINRFYERDVEYSVEKLTRMIEPLMTVLVGGIVLVILLALYMPVFSLGEAFKKA